MPDPIHHPLRNCRPTFRGGAAFVMPGHYPHRMDEHGNHNGSHGTNVRPVGRWAKVLNESWPKPDIAARMRELDVDQQIPVTARLVFETGEEHVPGMAVYWVRRPTEHVRVSIEDNRLQSGGVWLAPSDVVRR